MAVRIVLLLLLSIISASHSANILGVFHFPSESHHILGSALLKGLASRGHNVTMISPFQSKSPPANYNEVYLDGISAQKEVIMKEFMNPNVTIYERINFVMEMMQLCSRDVLENNNLQKFLQSEQKFDLVINLIFMNEALLGIGHTVNAPTIGFSVIGSSPWSNYHTSNPAPYAYVPHSILSYTDEMDFIQRCINSITTVFFDLILHFINMTYQQRLLTEFFRDAPPLTELLENIDLTFVNTHYSTETPRPYLPNIIQIGGFHMEDQQSLSGDLQKFMDGSENGVIYFSLGTNIKSTHMPDEKLKAILDTFRKSKYNILWKFEDDNLTDKPENVRLEKRLPQKAVLAHKNVKAFITHGGHGSTIESVYYGVPIVCIPFFGDQHKNTADSVKNGYGVKLDWDTLDEKSFTAAIEEITENKLYREKVALRSDLYRNREVSPMDKAVFWVEHVLKHGHAKHLKSRAHLLPWYQYMLVDVVCLTVVIFCMVIGFLYGVIKLFVCLCCGKKKCAEAKKSKKQKKQ